MDLGEILRVIRARWYVMAPISLVTIGLTIALAIVMPTTYQSQSTIALLNAKQPATATTVAQNNPFLIFDSSLTATADLLARSLTSDAAAKELKKLGVTEEYTAALADNAQGPFVTLTVTGTDKAHITAAGATLLSFAGRRLEEIQRDNGVPTANMISTATIIAPQPPEPQQKKKLQNVAGLLGGGIVLAFVATFLTESLARSRRPEEPAQRQVRQAAPGGSAALLESTAQVEATAPHEVAAWHPPEPPEPVVPWAPPIVRESVPLREPSVHREPSVNREPSVQRESSVGRAPAIGRAVVGRVADGVHNGAGNGQPVDRPGGRPLVRVPGQRDEADDPAPAGADPDAAGALSR
jgi:capsular polysaccharide biosynthesis protein